MFDVFLVGCWLVFDLVLIACFHDLDELFDDSFIGVCLFIIVYLCVSQTLNPAVNCS